MNISAAQNEQKLTSAVMDQFKSELFCVLCFVI